VKLRINSALEIAVLACCAAYFTGCEPLREHPEQNLPPQKVPQRIISALPSITEVLFDIGLGNRIVGVSSFTAYPPEAAKIDKIGGLYDINYEKILSLYPDVIIFSVENTELSRKDILRQSSIRTLALEHRTLQGVIDSYKIISEQFEPEVQTVALEKQAALETRLQKFAERLKNKNGNKVRTLLCIDRSRGTGRIQNLFVAGRDSFLTEALRLAGGENVTGNIATLAPTLSAEGIIGLAPEVIIDLCVNANDVSDSADWQSLGNSVPAVRNKRIYRITDDYATIPGPRTPLLIEKIEKLLSQ
jgi:iron complex transport system substrate-binding protein